MKKSKASQPDLIESLRDAGEAEEYLNAALEEGEPELFLRALRNVAESHGGGGTSRRKGQAQPRKLVQDTLRTRQS